MKPRLALLLVGLPLGLAVLSLTIPNAASQTVTVLYAFGSSPNNGYGPSAGLVQGSDGNFYGTTSSGGGYNYGTVFRITPSGTYTNLYSFAAFPGDGNSPGAALVQGSDGNFYGTTVFGGTTNYNPWCDCHGYGTIFRISPSGTYTSVYSFGGSPNDGENPYAGLVQGSDSNFYGTTKYGGTSTNCRSYGCGTVFRISPSGSYTNLYSFASKPTDGAEPMAGLVQGGDGNFYGTTSAGGAYGNGTVFRISPSGNETILYSFRGPPADGSSPCAGLAQGTDGNFYGTTFGGGTTDNCGDEGCGIVFRISPTGSYTSLYSFTSQPNDEYQTTAGLVQGSDGSFYGTSQSGVFRISPSGNETNLCPFNSHVQECVAGLVQGSDGNFYGTSLMGGMGDLGTVFKLTVPLSPPANQISGIQFFNVSGTTITIVALPIPSVAGETYQLQYSDSMSPANWINTGDPSLSIGGQLVLVDIAEPLPPQRFYRAVITP
ncbi:MAG: choice-of-anchor tandem repeat GloVer-containing protein [Verrucomicrobiia bacterium]